MAWTVNGIKVGETGFNAQFSNRSGMYEIEGRINTAARSINTTPAINEEQARSIAIQDMQKVTVDWPENAQTEIKDVVLIISHFNENLKLVWILCVIKGYQGYEYWIDAHTGEVLKSGPTRI